MAVYACSDLHGQGWAWDKIKEILKPEDTLYFLGDAIDRGPDGFKIMKEIMDRPNTIYLKGNHEDMAAKAILSHHFGRDMDLWEWNGGKITYNAIVNECELESERDEIANKMATLPLTAEYINTNGEIIKMSHSGIIDGSDEDILWDRNHFMSNKIEEEYSNYIIIHGHTPIEYLLDERNRAVMIFREKLYGADELEWDSGAYWYCENHKIDIDCGVHYTNKTVLLNLDTFDEEVIIGE